MELPVDEIKPTSDCTFFDGGASSFLKPFPAAKNCLSTGEGMALGSEEIRDKYLDREKLPVLRPGNNPCFDGLTYVLFSLTMIPKGFY